MPTLLKDKVRDLYEDYDGTIATLSRKTGVPYNTVYYFLTTGEDMRSEYMQKLYEYLTSDSLVEDAE